MGFCVGGLLTWQTALRSPDLAAAVPFYAVVFDPTPRADRRPPGAGAGNLRREG